jgi:hypothetical protein
VISGPDGSCDGTMNIVLISTSNVSSGRSEALDRMLMSVARATSTRPDISIALLLLLQKCSAGSVSFETFPAFVDVSSIPHQTSLSAARNVLLSRALSHGLIEPTTVVGFPDDDCWYPEGTLEYIGELFSRIPELDLWFCRYGSAPRSVLDVGAVSKPACARHVIRQASSNTMFVRGKIIQSGASFDEALGVGTPIGGAEDTEFALRAHIAGTQSMYLNAVVIGHRDKNPQLRAKYFRGGLIAIARHAQRQGGIVVELARKVAVGGWLMLRGELSFWGFLGALSEAFNAWRLEKAKLIPSGRKNSLG